MASKTHTRVLGVTEVDPSEIDSSLKPDENGILSTVIIPFEGATDEQLESMYADFPEVALRYWPEWVKENHPNKIN